MSFTLSSKRFSNVAFETGLTYYAAPTSPHIVFAALLKVLSGLHGVTGFALVFSII